MRPQRQLSSRNARSRFETEDKPVPELVIDPVSAIPLWHQLSEQIRSMIVRGYYRVGDYLPTEHEWSERCKVSSTTVRRALGELVHDELLERKAGKGTFVRTPRVRRDLRKVLGFTDNMKEMGLQPSTRVLSKQIVPAKEFALEKLRIKPRAKVLKLERLRLGNDIPMMLETRYIRIDLCPDIIKQDLAASLWKVFEDVYGLKPRRHLQSLSIVQASERASTLLGIATGSAMFFVRGATYLGDGSAIECEESTYRSDKYEFSFDATT